MSEWDKYENYNKSLWKDFKRIKNPNKELSDTEHIETTDYDLEAVKKYPNYKEMQKKLIALGGFHSPTDYDDDAPVRPFSVYGYVALVKPVNIVEVKKEEKDYTVEEWNFLFEQNLSKWFR